ncbi:MAG TPA: glycosyltransferase family 9 protein [Candidatus Binatia bacterium]|nr:glycosyltransferase family 9 protein [Candidatus Binatia bacterium]
MTHPERILIVNLTRFGDLLQTSPTIVGLKAQHPAAHVTVLVERNFADVCRGIPAIDRVWEIDLDRLGRLLLGAEGGLRQAYHEIEELVAALRAERFDLALNYSSSRMSAVLLGLIGVEPTRGWTMTADGYRLIAGRWSRLFSAACLNRRQAPFNLVDYYKRAAGVTGGPQRLLYDVAPAARAAARERLAGSGVAAETPLVAFQLGASRAVRRWPTASWVALGRELHARLGARLLLCGGGGDREVGAEVAAALGPLAIDCTGRTSIAELGALLERAHVLVTPDTGPMHMAVAVGTPVVALFFGPALPFDTGPYAADHVCLHVEVECAPCDHNVTCLEPFCRQVLAPAAVAEAVVARRANDWAALAAAADRWPALAWYRTGFDAEGLADVTLLGTRSPRRGETLRRAYRAFWKAVMDGAPERAASPALPEAGAALRGMLGLTAEAVRQARAVERLAAAGGDLKALEAAARTLEQLDARLFRFGAMHEPAGLLLQLFRFDKESIEGEDVAALARVTRELHERLAADAHRLAALLDPPTVRTGAVAREGEDHASLS